MKEFTTFLWGNNILEERNYCNISANNVVAEIITTTTTTRPCVKYKFVKRRPLSVVEEVCIDKKPFLPRRQRLCPEFCKAYPRGPGSKFIEQFKSGHSYYYCQALAMYENSDLTDTEYFMTFTRGTVNDFNSHEESYSLCSF